MTYPRTDARVLSTAVAKEIYKNISGLRRYPMIDNAAEEILQMGSYKTIAKTRYVNDKQITDHYAIIPTGQGLNVLNSLSQTSQRVYETIVRRFPLYLLSAGSLSESQSGDRDAERKVRFSGFLRCCR